MVTVNQTTANDPLDLMIRAKNGDRTAFGLLYKAYLTPIYRYALIRLGDTETAEDITQAVFLKVYENLHHWQSHNKSPLAFFFTVARNTIIDHWKKQKELPLSEEYQLIADATNLAEQVETNLAQKLIRKLINYLSPDQQEVINLKFIAGLSNHEIAELLDKSPGTIRQIQCRALKIMRHKMKLNQSL